MAIGIQVDYLSSIALLSMRMIPFYIDLSIATTTGELAQPSVGIAWNQHCGKYVAPPRQPCLLPLPYRWRPSVSSIVP